MADYAEADQRLMDWLAERTDTQLQRLLDAPEDGLTWDRYDIREDDDGTCRACLWGWAFDHRSDARKRPLAPYMEPISDEASEIVFTLTPNGTREEHRRAMRRIQSFAAAELLTRRVERKALPPAREVVTADPLNSLYSEV